MDVQVILIVILHPSSHIVRVKGLVVQVTMIVIKYIMNGGVTGLILNALDVKMIGTAKETLTEIFVF